MNKVKIMLSALFMLGIVGGALAYKASTTLDFCTAATVNGTCPTNAECPNGIANRKVTAVGGVIKCYVETTNTANCATDKPKCTAFASITAN